LAMGGIGRLLSHRPRHRAQVELEWGGGGNKCLLVWWMGASAGSWVYRPALASLAMGLWPYRT
jgi:hypothetical protein